MLPALDAAQRRQLFWLFGLALLVLGAGYGLRDPWPADEPRFVLVAKQMFEGGDWWFPHRGQELYPDKPPLFFWLLALARPRSAAGAGVSCCLPAVRPGNAVAGLRPRPPALESPGGLGAAIAILASCNSSTSSSGRRSIRPWCCPRPGPVRNAASPLAWAHLALVLDRLFFRGIGVILKGVGFLPLLVLLPYA
jgi:hypothetical protein